MLGLVGLPLRCDIVIFDCARATTIVLGNGLPFVGIPPILDKRIELGRSQEERRNTRVALKVVIAARGLSEPLKCDGENIVVNRRGLICTSVPLRVEMKIEIHVILTDKPASAKVVYVDPERPRICGVGLAQPENIWGLSFPPGRLVQRHALTNGVSMCSSSFLAHFCVIVWK